MKFSIYNVDTGQINRQIDCPASMVTMQVQEGEDFIPDTEDDSTHYVVDNAFVAFPTKPSPKHLWDWATKAWYDPRTLTDIQDEKWEAIKVSREAAFVSPLITPYGIFDCDNVSQKRIESSVVMMRELLILGSTPTIDFTLSDNSTATLTATEMITVGLLLGQKIQTAFGIARSLREAIYAATTTAAVEAIAWPT